MQKAANAVIQNTRLLLTQRRIPISELAKVLEIAPEEQEKILQKGAPLSKEEREKIAQFFGLSYNEFISCDLHDGKDIIQDTNCNYII